MSVVHVGLDCSQFRERVKEFRSIQWRTEGVSIWRGSKIFRLAKLEKKKKILNC